MVDIPHYYKLDRDPFLNEGVEGLFFPGGQRAELLEDLSHHARYNNSLLAVCGEMGVGKTTILDALFDTVADDTDIAAIVANPMMDDSQFASAVMEVLGEANADSDALTSLAAFLSNTNECDRLLLVLVDDAHNLPLETVSVLAQFQLDYKESFHLVFFTERSGSWLDHLVDKVTLQTWQLQPYNYEQMLAYIAYRMETAGWQGKLPFSEQQLNTIFKQSGGVPSLVNQLSTDTLYELMQAAQRRPMASRLPLIIGAAIGLSLLMLAIIWSDDDPSASAKLSDQQSVAGVVLREANNDKEKNLKNKKIVSLALPLSSDKKDSSNKKASINNEESSSKKENSQDKDSTQKKATSYENTIIKEVKVSNPNKQRQTEQNKNKNTILVKNTSMQQKSAEATVEEKNISALNGDKNSSSKAAENSLNQQAEKPAKIVVKEPAKAVQPVSKAPKIAKIKPSHYSKSEQKLLASPGDHYVLQLVGMSDRKRLDDYIRRLPKNIEPQTYRRTLNGKTLYMVVTGEFASSVDAQKGIKRLPVQLQKQKPWAKRLSSVHKEIISR